MARESAPWREALAREALPWPLLSAVRVEARVPWQVEPAGVAPPALGAEPQAYSVWKPGAPPGEAALAAPSVLGDARGCRVARSPRAWAE